MDKIFFNINIELLRTYLSMMRREEIDKLIKLYKILYGDRIKINSCAKRVFSNLVMSDGREISTSDELDDYKNDNSFKN